MTVMARPCLFAPLAVGLALSGCTAGQTPLESSEAPASAGVGIGQRDLTAEEKKVIMDAVAQSLVMSRCLLNIAKRSLLRLMLSCVGLASKRAAG